MNNVFLANYENNGSSVSTNTLGMREMQKRVYEKSVLQYILLKAPPASGKSRALMYVGLEKLKQNLVSKIIVAVPERSIAKSFANTDLISNGFHSNWNINRKYDLCSPGGDESKTFLFSQFMESEESILLCTHSTLRFAYSKLGTSAFDNCLIAIDEFHHVSADIENKLGELLRDVMNNTSAHILAMTGSYFRGDSVAVLSPSDEMKFREGRVTYNYYEQLNGYKYLKSLGIGFHFYQGRYLDSIKEVLNLNEKTIIHIPSVNSAESTKEKLYEVDKIIDVIGVVDLIDEYGIYHVLTSEGKLVKIADLVTDTGERDKVISYLRNVNHIDDIDIIIALGMAKEGFDWSFCQSTLTIGYRGSLTEIIQIIGRCTRDSENKSHAQFTNLIAEPDAERDDVVSCVNDIIKAITASLLMEEVIAPKYTFKSKYDDGDGNSPNNEIHIKGFREISSIRVKDIIDNDIVDLKARILQDSDIQNSIPGTVPPQTITKYLIPKVIEEVYPDLDRDEIKQLSDYIVVDSIISQGNVKEVGNRKIIEFANKLINVNDLDMDLIYSINPFLNAYEIMSKQLNMKVFKAIQSCIQAMKVSMTDDEAIDLWPQINDFYKANQRKPNLDSLDPYEKRLAEALIYVNRVKNIK